ncbi:MAG: GGDEF domain-containing protein [Pseudolabrys sp.]|nr:GGDEF domain-containing protein [Pseudolabrys sp.]MBV9955369.1 GGDEF domain-containing protein [Pseudolabrys sp.]
MQLSDALHPAVLDLSTLSFVAVCIAVLLGLVLLISWAQDRSMHALAWWGAAYLIGGSSIALWSAPTPLMSVPPEISGTLTFLACGMIWNGVRIFHGRRIRTRVAFAGAAFWLICSLLPGFNEAGRVVVSGIIVASYTFFIARELWRERRKSLFSRTAAIVVPILHGAIFLVPVVMKVSLSAESSALWMQVFVLETVIYSVGTAFIVLLLVKDKYVQVHRTAASTDVLTGLLNRRAFLENAKTLCERRRSRGEPVAVLLFDLDHFKKINDTFGHATGDEMLRVFAATTRATMRGNDIVGRLGGEEFAAIVPADCEITEKIAERVRQGFQAAGKALGELQINATVSIGAVCAACAQADVEPMLMRADEALYAAKNSGRNQLKFSELQAADVLPAHPRPMRLTRRQRLHPREVFEFLRRLAHRASG